MNSGLIFDDKTVEPPSQPDWQAQLKHWCDLIVRCGRKPGCGRVHNLRVSTLRLQTQVEAWLPGHPADEAVVLAARRWIRQAEKLRKVLSPVRDADVSLEMLAGLCSPGASEAGEVSPEAHDYLRAIVQLQRRLERRRAAAGKKLAIVLKVQRDRLLEAGGALERALAEPAARPAIDCGSILRALVAEMAADVPHLSATTLHDFRKHAKAGRYLAEIAGPHDPWARRQAARFKAVQAVAGQWHDWQTLADEAACIADGCAGDALVRLLAQLAERSLGKALDVCRRIARERRQKKDTAQTLRKPVRPVMPEAISQHYA